MSSIKHLQRTQASTLLTVLQTEMHVEGTRQSHLSSITDPDERKLLEELYNRQREECRVRIEEIRMSGSEAVGKRVGVKMEGRKVGERKVVGVREEVGDVVVESEVKGEGKGAEEKSEDTVEVKGIEAAQSEAVIVDEGADAKDEEIKEVVEVEEMEEKKEESAEDKAAAELKRMMMKAADV